MSFLDKIKFKVDEKVDTEEIKDGKIDKSSGFMQLEVDIYQTDSAIVVIAPLPGVDIKDIDISIENENDVVTIQGDRPRPDDDGVGNDKSKFLRQECRWGHFYRQIILPQEINVAEVEAKLKKGILSLRLPLLLLQTKGKKKITVK